MDRPPQPLFLARQSYRRRRLGDAARLIPLLGVVLLLIPVLWSTGHRTSFGIIYIFAVWGGLIVIIGLLARPLAKVMTDHDRPEEPDEPES